MRGPTLVNRFETSRNNIDMKQSLRNWRTLTTEAADDSPLGAPKLVFAPKKLPAPGQQHKTHKADTTEQHLPPLEPMDRRLLANEDKQTFQLQQQSAIHELMTRKREGLRVKGDSYFSGDKFMDDRGNSVEQRPLLVDPAALSDRPLSDAMTAMSQYDSVTNRGRRGFSRDPSDAPAPLSLDTFPVLKSLLNRY